MAFWRSLRWLDRPRYIAWRLLPARNPIEVTFDDGTRISMRPRPSADYGVAYEVLHERIYESPFPEPSKEIRTIVDLGANVGYSCLFWAKRYPKAEIVAFEPHPVHADLLRLHLRMNGVESRVQVHEAAAGVEEGEVMLTDSRTSSKIATGPTDGKLIPVKVADFFNALGDRSIDILKVDVEGHEYPLLADPRFDRVAARMLVVEWHRTKEYPNGHQWCLDRLGGLGYEIKETQNVERSGVLWGRKS